MIVKLSNMMIDIHGISVVKMLQNSIEITYKNGSKTNLVYTDKILMKKDYDIIYKNSNKFTEKISIHAKDILSKAKKGVFFLCKEVKKSYDDLGKTNTTKYREEIKKDKENDRMPIYISITEKNFLLPELIKGTIYKIDKEGYIIVNRIQYVHYTDYSLKGCGKLIY